MSSQYICPCSLHSGLDCVHVGGPVGVDVLAGGGLRVDELTVDGDLESARGLGVTLERVVEVFLAEFCIHVLHRFDSVLAVSSAAAVLNNDGDLSGAKLF